MKQKLSVAPTLKNYDKKNLPKDILAGIIIMAVSIPISMGYAQISGLPAVYGLYGSVFPIILFALFSTSPQFIFGVDAAPAALVGAAVLGMGIEAGSKEAMTVVPVFTFFVALWLLAFYFMNAGKLVNYISAPVMGGFITGICTTIILMQAPKLMGSAAGTGELFELSEHIWEALHHINAAALVMGIVALAILVVSKRLVPKFPMAVVLMVTGALFTYFGPVKEWGVPTLSAVEPGMPRWYIPDFEAVFSVQKASEVIVLSLSVAVVIMAETLLAENNFAQKNGYRIDDNTELLAFSIGNMAAAFTGCCPINGSVSRTAMSEQYEGKTQLTGLVAGVSMIAVLLFLHRLYRISAGSGAHGDCHISAHGCHGVSSGKETVEGQQDRIFHICWCFFRSTYSGYDKRSFDRNHFVFCRDDNQKRKAGHLLSRCAAGTQSFPRYQGEHKHPRD